MTLGSHLRQKDHNNNYGDDDDGNKGKVKKKEKKQLQKEKKSINNFCSVMHSKQIFQWRGWQFFTTMKV